MTSQAFVINDSVTKRGYYEPFELQVSRNQITGHTSTNIFGYGTTPATAGTFRTVWENMLTTEYVFPSSAVTMQLVSAAAGDTATITIVGLDASYNLLTESLVLNGTTNVPTVNQYFRINNMFVSVGSATNPSGVITAKSAKVDKKLRMIDLQIKKHKLDQDLIKQSTIVTANDNAINIQGDGFVVEDRNSLMAKLKNVK